MRWQVPEFRSLRAEQMRLRTRIYGRELRDGEAAAKDDRYQYVND